MSDKKTIIKNFQSMKPSIALKQLDYSKLPKEVRDKMKGDLSGVSDDTLDLQFEQSTFKKWVETFADLYPSAFGIKEDVKVVSVAPVAKVEPVVKSEPIVVAEEKTVDTSELETKIKDLETRLSVVNKMILKQPLKKTELKIRVKTIEKMIAKFKEELKNKKSTSKKKVVKKSLGGFLLGAAGGFIAGQMIDLQLTRKKVRFDLGGTIHGDKKYNYSITYRTIFQSENEESPYEDGNGFEVENEIEELQDILQEAVNKYGIYAPTGSPIHAGISFESVTPKQDRDYFEKGIETYFTLHVKNVDGSDISLEETQLIADKLKEGRKLHWDEEEKNWWKDGGEIHSKDDSGTLIFKADTKGGKYSIEVREDSTIHGVYYSIKNYTNGSSRGAGSESNKELLKHKLIDTIIGSKKIDGINYIISHDDLGVKEYLPASEKIWDIYNSAEFREWFKKQNETLTEEQKKSLSDELKNKAIKYVRDNGYKENDSTIGSFFQLFRKERLIKDFYESKGMVMLKDGGNVKSEVEELVSEEELDRFIEYVDGFYGKEGIYAEELNGGFTKKELESAVNNYIIDINNNKNPDVTWGGGDSLDRERVREYLEKKDFKDGGNVQTKKWLSDMNQERLNELKSKRAEIEETMPEDFVETSGGSGRTKAEILADFDKAITERENKKFASGGSIKSEQPNFEKVKKAFYRLFENSSDVDFMILRETVNQKIFLPTYHKRRAQFNKDLDNWLDTVDIRQVVTLIDSVKDKVSLPTWIKNKEFTIDYNENGFLDLIKKSHEEYANGGDFEKALENLHSKASSSTTPRGRNKINIPVTDEKQRLVEFILNDILSKNPDVDESKYRTLINFNLGKVKKHTWGAGYFLQNLGETVLKDAKSSVNTNNFFNAETEIAVSKYETGNSDESYESSRDLARLKKQPLGDKFGKGGGVDLNKDKFSLATINDDLVQMVIGEDWTAKEFKEHFLNKGYELKPDNSIVGFYFAKPDGQTFQLVPSFHKKGEIIKYKDGGSMSSDNTPKVYIADLAAYNEGKLVGEWLDLSEFGSGEEVMEKISELLKQWSEEAGEEREEYSVHDMENFPKQMYSEGMGEDSFQKVIDYWEAINGTDYPMEVVEEYAALRGDDIIDAANNMKDAYYGKFDDVEDFAREYVDSVGGIEGVSNPEQYIDISETDKRIMSSEQADSDVENMSDDDILKRANLDSEYQEAEEYENEEEMERILEEAKESVREEIESEWEKGLEDPYNFLVEEQGLYDASSIMNANFIMFDYERFGKDLEQDYYVIEHDGEVYVFSQNYRKGGSLSSTRTLGVSKEKVEIEIPEFRPEKLKEKTKTNKKQKTKTMAKKSAGSNKNKERMTLIQSEAKKIWAEGKLKKYSEAVSLASKKLKKEGKL